MGLSSISTSTATSQPSRSSSAALDIAHLQKVQGKHWGHVAMHTCPPARHPIKALPEPAEATLLLSMGFQQASAWAAAQGLGVRLSLRLFLSSWSAVVSMSKELTPAARGGQVDMATVTSPTMGSGHRPVGPPEQRPRGSSDPLT